MNPKELHLRWLRSSVAFQTVHKQLEEELQRMKDRKVNQDFIDKKDLQIETLIDFYNQTDELMQVYKIALANARFENVCLTEMLIKQVNLTELVQYNPSNSKS